MPRKNKVNLFIALNSVSNASVKRYCRGRDAFANTIFCATTPVSDSRKIFGPAANGGQTSNSTDLVYKVSTIFHRYGRKYLHGIWPSAITAFLSRFTGNNAASATTDATDSVQQENTPDAPVCHPQRPSGGPRLPRPPCDHRPELFEPPHTNIQKFR